MTGWLLVLILFLWITGGSAWINFYEVVEELEMNGAGKVITTILWPLMALIAATSQAWSELRMLAGRAE